MPHASFQAFLKHSSPIKPAQQPAGPGDPRGIASIPSIVSSDATSTPETESSPQAVKPAPENVNSGSADALLMAAYAMTELNAEESPTRTAANDNIGLRPSPKRKSTDVAHSAEDDMDGGDDDSAPFESPPTLFPDSMMQQDYKDAPPAMMTNKSPLVTPAQQRKSKRSRVGTDKKSSAFKKDNASSINGTLGEKRSPAESDDEPENMSPTSTKSSSSVEEEQEVVATPITTRSRSKKALQKDVLTPVSARVIDFRRMSVKGKTRADSDGSDEEQMEEIAAS